MVKAKKKPARKPAKTTAKRTMHRKPPSKKGPARKKQAAGRPRVRVGKSLRVKKSSTHTQGRPATARKALTKSTVWRRGRMEEELVDVASREGLGPESGGQSGDTQGLSRAEFADSESVEELLEEGQSFEAGIVSGVENAPDADRGEIRTRQVPEDDVPEEYLDED